MIGQSGLPMMNNLAGSNEKTPEDIRAKNSATDAGAFEKLLVPDDQAFVAANGQSELPAAKQESQLIDERQVVGLHVKSSTESETVARQETVQQFIAPITAVIEAIKREPSTRQHPATNDQTLVTAPEISAIQLRSLNAEKSETTSDSSANDAKTQSEVSPDGPISQATEFDAIATSPEALAENTGQPRLPESSQVDEGNVPQNQPKVTLPLTEAGTNELGNDPGKPIAEASKIASSPDSPDLPAASSESISTSKILPTGEEGNRLSQQASTLPTASLPDHGSETIAAMQVKSGDSADTTVLEAERSETNARLATNQPSELRGQPPQPQVEVLQDQPRTQSSRSNLPSAAALIGAASQPDLAATSSASSSFPTKAGEPKIVVPTAAPLVQAMAPETSSLAQGALSEQSDFLLGPSSTITSTASSRLDAPSPAAAPLPASADAKLVVHQVNQAIIRMDGTRTEIILDPVELGRVSLTFITKDEGVTVLINADRPETADLLRRNSEQLQRDLSNAGYDGVELDFDQGDDTHPDPAAADKVDDIGTTISSSVSYESNFITSGLDIRI